jgi:catechol 2,3-dioxygenase-like lactoylglutathione lyase family enzyme
MAMRMETRRVVPMVFVADVETSIRFYEHLGFEVANTFAPEGAAKPSWAWLQSGEAALMLARANEAIVADQQRILFYLYAEDVTVAHASLAEAGLNPGVITTPFYAPRGEFKMIDPDGYVLMITHT